MAWTVDVYNVGIDVEVVEIPAPEEGWRLKDRVFQKLPSLRDVSKFQLRHGDTDKGAPIERMELITPATKSIFVVKRDDSAYRGELWEATNRLRPPSL